ncbi:DUF3763 domain-containing protein [Salmonella enterica subsp. enterica]|uniref:DUF3763 domain-containing protein n=2 Tax=Salmonella enterica TaxID=28901 RepID=A0A744KEM7_SALER|nr:DUF3763 domain-containing protein [Salmonella enterica subsp. enterica serovar Aqua]ELE9458816.1 DUF3763 domain-containing protein [Salmonella enterica]ECH1168685.1 DUF3763 domain-containing protein [Salmonella enterica subsp. enterica serovar Aqua]EIK6738928.1 DUF3763 domain-containing protein [Salmonella enterica subsp. enterica serovar Aqua]ELF7040109.1 DUF3763 domain-containing protein [Salmonella enterica]
MHPSYSLAERVSHIIYLLEKGLNEYRYTIRLCLLSALSGGSIYLLNAPDVVKEFITQQLKLVFLHARVFEYSMSQSSLPATLVDQDRNFYSGMGKNLSQAEIVFFDNIWSANPKYLNYLIAAIDKKYYRNGTTKDNIPIRLFAVASRELPDDKNAFNPLYERLLMRLWGNNMRDINITQLTFVNRPNGNDNSIPIELQVTDEEYLQWQRDISLIFLPNNIFELIFKLRNRFKNMTMASDRQWRKATHLLQASAFFSGRNAIAAIDLILLKECMWHDIQSLNFIQQQLNILMTTEAWNQKNMLTCLDSIAQSHIESQKQNNNTGLSIIYTYSAGNNTFHYCLPKEVDTLILTLLLKNSLIFNNIEIMFITLDYYELKHWLERGGDIRGKLNGAGNPQSLKMKINIDLHLVLYNEIMQNTQLLLLSGNMTRERKQQLEKLNKEWKKQYASFHKQQKSFFIHHDWLSIIRSSIKDVGIRIQQVYWGDYSFYCSQILRTF